MEVRGLVYRSLLRNIRENTIVHFPKRLAIPSRQPRGASGKKWRALLNMACYSFRFISHSFDVYADFFPALISCTSYVERAGATPIPPVSPLHLNFSHTRLAFFLQIFADPVFRLFDVLYIYLMHTSHTYIPLCVVNFHPFGDIARISQRSPCR